MSRYTCWNCKTEHGTDNVEAVCVQCYVKLREELAAQKAKDGYDVAALQDHAAELGKSLSCTIRRCIRRGSPSTPARRRTMARITDKERLNFWLKEQRDNGLGPWGYISREQLDQFIRADRRVRKKRKG